MGHLRSRFSTHLSAKTPVLPQKIRPKSLFRNILPLTSTRSIFCADFRLSPPMFSIFYEHRGRGRGVRPYTSVPLWETKPGKQIPRPPCGGLVMTNQKNHAAAGLKARSSTLTAPTRTPAAHAAVAAPVPGHDRAADRATGCVAHIDQLFHGVS